MKLVASLAAALALCATASASGTVLGFSHYTGSIVVGKSYEFLPSIDLSGSTPTFCFLDHPQNMRGVPRSWHLHRRGGGTVTLQKFTTGQSIPTSGCNAIPRTWARGIIANPSAYYVEIHTSAGSARAQLRRRS